MKLTYLILCLHQLVLSKITIFPFTLYHYDYPYTFQEEGIQDGKGVQFYYKKTAPANTKPYLIIDQVHFRFIGEMFELTLITGNSDIRLGVKPGEQYYYTSLLLLVELQSKVDEVFRLYSSTGWKSKNADYKIKVHPDKLVLKRS